MRQQRSKQAGRIGWFLLVGGTAAAVHWGVAVALIRHGHWPPLVANVAGWLTAFMVSFSGHVRLTFREHRSPLGSVAMRFFLISASGFAINEAAYAALLRWGHGRAELLLALVLAAVAGLTYWLSRHWAFLRSEVP